MFRFTAKVRLSQDEFPVVDVPLRVGRALGGKERMDVRAVVNGVPFHARIFGKYQNWDWFMHSDETPPVADYTLYMYKDMRKDVPVTHLGQELDIELSLDTSPRRVGRRGKRIR